MVSGNGMSAYDDAAHSHYYDAKEDVRFVLRNDWFLTEDPHWERLFRPCKNL